MAWLFRARKGGCAHAHVTPFLTRVQSAARECTRACECAFIARALRISEAIESDRATVRVRGGAKGMKGQAIDAIGHRRRRRFGPASIFAFVIYSRPYRSAIAIG